MNTSECNSGENTIVLNETQSYVIQIMLLTTSITIVIPNCLQVAVIVKTLQFRVNSTKLALYLALCDLCLVVFRLLPRAYMLRKRNSAFEVIASTTTNITEVFFFCFCQNSWLISYDRYLHDKCPNRYSEVLPTKKLGRLELLCLFAAAFISALSYINDKVIQFRVPFLTFPFGIMITIIVTFYYMRSIKLLSEHRLRRTKVSQNDKDITKLAKYILLTFGCFHFTSLCIMGINFATNTQYRNFVTLLHRSIFMLYSPINVISFFFINRTSSQYLKKLYRRYFKTSTVANHESVPIAMQDVKQNHHLPTKQSFSNQPSNKSTGSPAMIDH